MSTAPHSDDGHGAAGALQQRYGVPSRSRQLLLVGGVALVSVVFLGWLAWATWVNADPAVSSELVASEIVDDHTSTATVRVQYGDDPVDAECTVRAIARDKVVVGQVTFHPEPDEGPDHEVEVATERRATAVELLGCTTEGQPRPR